MKQFSLEEFKKNPNRKVVTRDGRPVRIICTDAKGIYPVVGLALNKEAEVPENYTENGCYLTNDRCDDDIFLDAEKKEGWLNLHRNDMGFIMPGYLYDTEEQALEEIRDKERHVATVKISWEE